ncbi:MAG: hypothetical protein COV36_02420 [Alphaproteobacteria bacterium CG11_big_fil_rev_8_21_14_0_20_44_7]|nr:MAG: hypothetical protein COV36_02420 [Alphaproteobacteria bacterium CG11_big_fil_rev_8_21_14_0_20_44_7]
MFIDSLKNSLKNSLKRFYGDTEGSFIIIFAFTALLLVGVTGAALDYARANLLRSELTSALDAAVLAAGASVSSDDLEGVLQKYFTANFPDGYMGASVDNFVFTLSEDGETLTASVEANLDYSLLQTFLGGDMGVAASTEVTLEKRGMEIVLVMDNTGSMNGSKMTTMKNAAQNLINILYGANEVVDNMWIGLVPYTATVNIGNNNTGWVSGLDEDDFSPTTWKGCIEARGAAEATDDTPAVGGLWTPYLYADASDNNWKCTGCSISGSNCGDSSNIYKDTSGSKQHWVNENQCARNDGTGPNLGCGPAITPLRQAKTTISDAIDDMDAWHRGGTFSNIGLSWGWRAISPKWQGLWSGVDAAQPFDYDEPLMEKVVIILTDGQNQFYDHNGGGPSGSDYTAYGRLQEEIIGAGINTQGEGTAEINAQFSQTCEDMKDEGIIIYTITFQTSGSIRDVYRDCATSNAHYFDSPSNDELDEVFEEIGDSLSNLRLSK